ncbi:hypothetical protein L9F63_015828 [Diploptera punctata]|uniref:DNA-directed RNA polymerases I and III subunit RPAC1 n=1 Tax=Diploptera punctata TaxID=6984 RepID=A0AAD8EJI1_DIPPU|nr:hypothetical protein L9F63_015828 [Diploptera punctata]
MDVIQEGRDHVVLKENGVLNAYSSDYPGSYDCDDAWNLEKFKQKFRVDIITYSETEMEFDLIGIHAALVNAFRRLLLSEVTILIIILFCLFLFICTFDNQIIWVGPVPSMAIEKVFIYNNTTIIQDEVLAHRLGLLPLKADPRLFEYRQPDDKEGTEQDTLEFELKIKCTTDPNAPKNSTNPDDLYKNQKVYPWLPIGGQGDIYKEEEVGPVSDDILVCKMRPGHELDLKLHAVKGIGKDHAKFSPVATTFYRLLPQLRLTRDVVGEQAERLQKYMLDWTKVAKVNDARYDTCSRNVYRYDDLKDAIELTRVRDHFIFTIESVGALPPDVLFIETLKLLKTKCRAYLDELNHA